MAGDNFWNNREQAQKLIDEANSLRGKIEPLIEAEKQLDDFRVMTELGQAEPPAAQPKVLRELERDVTKFLKDLDALELRVFLSGPHDRCNCIMSINAGAGGTEAQDWAEMLSRMYQRWAESRGWEVEVEDALPGEGAGLKSVTDAHQGRERLRFLQSRARRASARAHLAVRLEQTPPHEFCQCGYDCGNRGGFVRDCDSRQMNFRWTRFVPAAKAVRT
jgi:peptide chain release factor 2